MGILVKFGGWLVGAFLTSLGGFVAQALVSLGVGVVTYAGLSTSIDWLKSNLISSFAGLPSEVIGMLSLMQVGSCLSMVFSAMALRMTLQGFNGATFKRWVKK